VDTEKGFELGFEGEGFREEEPGVDGENGERDTGLDGVMDGDESGALEAGADGCGFAVLLIGPGEDLGEGRIFEGRVESSYGVWGGRI
jgi:hypothetical protein